MIPIAELMVEFHPTIIPQPMCFHVRVKGKTIAILEYDEVKNAFERIESLFKGLNARS